MPKFNYSSVLRLSGCSVSAIAIHVVCLQITYSYQDSQRGGLIIYCTFYEKPAARVYYQMQNLMYRENQLMTKLLNALDCFGFLRDVYVYEEQLQSLTAYQYAEFSQLVIQSGSNMINNSNT